MRTLTAPPPLTEVEAIHTERHWQVAINAFREFALEMVPVSGQRTKTASPAVVEQMRSDLWTMLVQLTRSQRYLDRTDGPCWEPSKRRRKVRAAPHFVLREGLSAELFAYAAILMGYFKDLALATSADVRLLRRCELEDCGRIFVATCRTNAYQPEPYCKQRACLRRRERERKAFARQRLRNPSGRIGQRAPDSR